MNRFWYCVPNKQNSFYFYIITARAQCLNSRTNYFWNRTKIETDTFGFIFHVDLYSVSFHGNNICCSSSWIGRIKNLRSFDSSKNKNNAHTFMHGTTNLYYSFGRIRNSILWITIYIQKYNSKIKRESLQKTRNLLT